jgi:hypothetical protein
MTEIVLKIFIRLMCALATAYVLHNSERGRDGCCCCFLPGGIGKLVSIDLGSPDVRCPYRCHIVLVACYFFYLATIPGYDTIRLSGGRLCLLD